MDTQALFNIAVSLAGVLGGWILNNIWQSIRLLDKDVRQMPHVYVAKEDYKADISEIKSMLAKIFDKLEAKADKA
jgi:hypothetical protein